MLQYIEKQIEFVKSSKDVRTIKIIGFRDKTQFDDDDRLLGKIRNEELIRIDLVSKRLLNDEYLAEHIIDANDKDVFSFAPAETIIFPNPQVVGVV